MSSALDTQPQPDDPEFAGPDGQTPPIPLDGSITGMKPQHPNASDTASFLPLTSDPVPRFRRLARLTGRLHEKAPSQPRRFISVPIETTYRHVSSEPLESRRTSSGTQDTVASGLRPNDSALNQRRRQFIPQLIESSRRTRRAGDTKPAVTPSDRTDVPGLDNSYFSGRVQGQGLPVPPRNSPLVTSPVITTSEARKLGIPLPKRSLSQSSTNSHSYKPTDLETIPSSESDRSGPRSRRSSHSSRSSVSFKHATRIRESVDESSSGYLLELAAKAAEKQIQEQALAAFPNDDRHQTISHYMDTSVTPAMASSTSELDLNLDRRISTNWELKELQSHHAKLEEKREAERKRREKRRKLNEHLDKNPWDLPIPGEKNMAADVIPTCAAMLEKDDEWEKMRSKARPPMLGQEIEFPRCASPDPARFDVTQGPEHLKQQMCYLTLQSTDEPCGSGLWTPQRSQASRSSMWSQQASRTSTNCGLWGGSCLPPADVALKGPTGILTPHVPESDSTLESGYPSQLRNPLLHKLPPSPPPSNSGMANLDEKLTMEEAIAREFDDSFVTQAYNYCSLGYPALAWRYDDELSKISRIPIEELRQDDHLPSSRGYIRLGENEQTDPEVTEEKCARWRALKVYIHEWARQQPNFAKSPEMEGAWTAARKGSWGF